jgi:glutamyl-tRNA synthetase
LSKRDGDRLGFPVFTINWTDPSTKEKSVGFRERGFFQEPLVNFLALLGWHPAGDKEVMTMEQMISEFSMEHIHKAGAKFDFEKAKWFNHEHMKKMSGDKLAEYFIPTLLEKNVMLSGVEPSISEEYVARVCDVLKSRCNFLSEFWENGNFFFQRPTSFDESVVKSKWNEKAKANFDLLIEEMNSFNDYSPPSVDEFLHSFLQKNNLKAGDMLPILRVALIGTKNGPSVFEIISLLGKDESQARMKNAISTFEKMISPS